MIATLAFRHLLVHRRRSLFLLLGYGLGVGVMIVLLSVGEAMLEQSRDLALIGGGEVTVLPEGIDVEAMRTGGAGGMFFGIDRARFLTRQLLGGRRQEGIVAAVSPAIEHKLVYLSFNGRTVVARAGAEIPSRARLAGAPLDLLEGRWDDHAADSTWLAPTKGQLYDEMDRFHLPRTRDSSWAEWHYFNVVTGDGEWWYLTWLVGGDLPNGRWGGQVLLTRRTPDGGHQRFAATVPASAITLDTTRADLLLGPHTVRQREGIYTLTATAEGSAGRARVELEVTPERDRYFPPVELLEGRGRSGYVVPALRATATGRLCIGPTCQAVVAAPAYHDHNWGAWRAVTWDWGALRGRQIDLLFGAVYTEAARSGPGGMPSMFVAVVDSLGVRQVLRARPVRYGGTHRRSAALGFTVPASFTLRAGRESDSLLVEGTVEDVDVTPSPAAGAGQRFLQMRGRVRMTGTVAGAAVSDEGEGFFETYVTVP
ncbi:MAG: hypothetical protein OEW80_02265 [Gemmatimonadota bacterium]|nr:hypothetical protein [Gemmatimonadota bacterium]